MRGSRCEGPLASSNSTARDREIARRGTIAVLTNPPTEARFNAFTARRLEEGRGVYEGEQRGYGGVQTAFANGYSRSNLLFFRVPFTTSRPCDCATYTPMGWQELSVDILSCWYWRSLSLWCKSALLARRSLAIMCHDSQKPQRI